MMRRSLAWFAAIFALLVANSVYASGRIFEVAYPPSDKPGELVYGVSYRVWIPDGVVKLRGVIVHQHGCGKGACQGGETAADDLHWQALAKKWDCALLGPSFQQEDGQNCRLWCDPRKGSRARFLQALDDLASKSGHSELARVPWCLWGHSGGGFWASLMQASDPERIVAIWLRSGTAFTAWEKGEIDRPEIRDTVYQIPVVCNPGVKENADPRFNGAWTGAMSMFKAYRQKGAPIAFAPDPRTGHECGDSRYLAIPYFDACLAARLPAVGSDDLKLRPVDLQQGWLAAPLALKAEPFDSYLGSKSEAGWLPSENVARAWSQYVKTGVVDDNTPPAPPLHPRAGRKAEGVEIVWDAQADLESGLREFVITRDGKEVARVPEAPQGRFGRALFQGMSYHDTPEKPVRTLRFVDTTATGSEIGLYEVTSVNGSGLHSQPARAARP